MGRNAGSWAIANIGGIRNGKPLRFVFFVDFTTLCLLGLGLGHPWVSQGSRKGLPGVMQGSPKRQIVEVSLLATKHGKCRAGADLTTKGTKEHSGEKQNLTADQR